MNITATNKIKELAEHLNNEHEFIIYGTTSEGGKINLITSPANPAEDITIVVNQLLDEFIRN